MSLDLKRQLVAQIVESSRLLRNFIEHRAKSRGTTRAQWIVLFRLRQQEGLSQVDLADVLELQPISLVRLLDRLVEHGLLERRPDPRDRRANRLFLTRTGRRLVDDLDSLRDAIAGDILRDVSDRHIEKIGRASCRERVAALAVAGSLSTESCTQAARSTAPAIALFFFQAEDGIRDGTVTGVQTCALPISCSNAAPTPGIAAPIACS